MVFPSLLNEIFDLYIIVLLLKVYCSTWIFTIFSPFVLFWFFWNGNKSLHYWREVYKWKQPTKSGLKEIENKSEAENRQWNNGQIKQTLQENIPMVTNNLNCKI